VGVADAAGDEYLARLVLADGRMGGMRSEWEKAFEELAVFHGNVEGAEDWEIGLSAVRVAAEHVVPGEFQQREDGVGVVLENERGEFGVDVLEGGGGVGEAGPKFVEADDLQLRGWAFDGDGLVAENFDAGILDDFYETFVDGAVGGSWADVAPRVFVVIVVAEDGDDAVLDVGGFFGEAGKEGFGEREGAGVVVDEVAGDEDDVRRGREGEETVDGGFEVALAGAADVEVGEMEDCVAAQGRREVWEREGIACEFEAIGRDEARDDEGREGEAGGVGQDAVDDAIGEKEPFEGAAAGGFSPPSGAWPVEADVAGERFFHPALGLLVGIKIVGVGFLGAYGLALFKSGRP